MSVFRTAMVWLGLVDDDEYDAKTISTTSTTSTKTPKLRSRPPRAEPDGTGRTHRARPPRRRARSPCSGVATREEPEPPPAPARPTSAVKAIPMPTTRVHVMDPRGFNDAQEVGDRLKNGQPVILNLQGVDRDLQRRLIDFSSGLAYALSGTMSKAADQVFLLTPSNVEVSDEEKERLQARGPLPRVAPMSPTPQ